MGEACFMKSLCHVQLKISELKLSMSLRNGKGEMSLRMLNVKDFRFGERISQISGQKQVLVIAPQRE
jgi:hypothetical protein